MNNRHVSGPLGAFIARVPRQRGPKPFRQFRVSDVGIQSDLALVPDVSTWNEEGTMRAVRRMHLQGFRGPGGGGAAGGDGGGGGAAGGGCRG